jgi:hypothetical protein
MPLSTVHGHVHPISGNGCRGGTHAPPGLAGGPYTSLGLGGSIPRGSGAPMLTLQGSGEAEIVPDRVQGSGTLITSCGLERGGNRT